MPTIQGEATQARTGRVVLYRVSYDTVAPVVPWSGEVLLREGVWHELMGGEVQVPPGAGIGNVIATAVHAQIEALDLDRLNAMYGN